MFVIKNEKVVLIKPMGELATIGNVYEVANFTNKTIVLRDEKTKIAMASVGFEEFEEYFAKQEQVKTWTDWHDVADVHANVIGYYKTNGRKVKFKTPDGFKSESTCCKEDDFNLAFGIRLAMARTTLKVLKAEQEILSEEFTHLCDAMNEKDSQIAEQKNAIKRMIRSLDEKEVE